MKSSDESDQCLGSFEKSFIDGLKYMYIPFDC